VRAGGFSLLGAWQAPLGTLCGVAAAAPPLALALAQHPAFVAGAAPRGRPAAGGGRALEHTSLLGPFLAVSVLPDDLPSQRAPPPTALLGGGGRRADAAAAAATAHMLQGSHAERLHGLFLALAKAPAGREPLLSFVAALLAASAGRAKMQADPRGVASRGALLSLASVMLRMCAPFAQARPGSADAKAAAQWGYLANPGYLAHGRLPAGADETRLGCTAEEAAAWAAAAPPPPPAGHHFVTDCFFLTQRALHLGLISCFRALQSFLEDAGAFRRQAEELEAQRGAWAATPQAAQLEARLEDARADAAAHAQHALLFAAALSEPRLLADALAFYALTARWLLELGGAGEQGLPAAAPPAFRALPEWVAEDVAECLLAVTRHAPAALQAAGGAQLTAFLEFLVLLLGAPEHARNPYLRAKLVEVLRAWCPPAAEAGGGARETPAALVARPLFEHHPLCVRALVPNLLTLYVDIEFGGGRSVFYDKMNIRHSIGGILEYLWGCAGHRASWRQLAAQHTPGFYLRFVDMLMSDAQLQLGEALKLVPEVRQLEEMRADGRLARLPATEQRERALAPDQLRGYLALAAVQVRMLRFTAADGATAAPLLRPEMVDRVAALLNYFLSYLVGPERGTLRLPAELAERLGWDPKALLGQLVAIYCSLHEAGGAAFAAAAARDERSYRDANVTEAAAVLRALGLLGSAEEAQLEAFAEAARAHAALGAAEEEAFADPPPEFEDALMGHLMADPLRLPAGDYVLDRPTIERHLLSNNTCPFTRSPLSADQLRPDHELRQRIADWKAARRAEWAARAE